MGQFIKDLIMLLMQLSSLLQEGEGVRKNYGRSSNTNNDFPVDVLIIIGIIIIYLVLRAVNQEVESVLLVQTM